MEVCEAGREGGRVPPAKERLFPLPPILFLGASVMRSSVGAGSAAVQINDKNIVQLNFDSLRVERVDVVLVLSYVRLFPLWLLRSTN